MTLSELYDQLDWTQADLSTKNWAKVKGLEDLPMDDLKTRRCNILFGAMYDDDPKRREFCQKSLIGVGIWGQVIDIMRQKGLVEYEQAQEPDHQKD